MDIKKNYLPDNTSYLIFKTEDGHIRDTGDSSHNDIGALPKETIALFNQEHHNGIITILGFLTTK